MTTIADVAVLPGARLMTVPVLPDTDRIIIAQLVAGSPDLSDDAALAVLRIVASPNLTGAALSAAAAETLDAVQIHTETGPDDPDADDIKDTAGAAVFHLVYGPTGTGAGWAS